MPASPSRTSESQAQTASASLPSFTPPDWQSWFRAHREAGAADLDDFRLHLAVQQWELAHGLDLNTADDLRCLQRVDLSEGLADPAVRLLRDHGGRGVLVDADGGNRLPVLGALAAELLTRGLIHNALFLCPAGRADSWQQMLQDSFHLPTTRGSADGEGFGEDDLVVMSFEEAEQAREELSARSWGFVAVEGAEAVAEGEFECATWIDPEKSFACLAVGDALHGGAEGMRRMAAALGRPLDESGEESEEIPEGWASLLCTVSAGGAGGGRGARDWKAHPAAPEDKEQKFLSRAYASLSLIEDSAVRARAAEGLACSSWGFSEAVAQVVSEGLVTDAKQREMLQKLAVDGRALLEGGKTQALLRLAKRSGRGGKGRKTVVFAHHRETVQQLQRVLSMQGMRKSLVTLMEGQAQRNRQLVEDFFAAGNEQGVLLASDSTATGLDLSGASAVVHYDLPWRPSILEQRMALVESGEADGKRACHALSTKGTWEEELVLRLYDKMGLLHQSAGGSARVLAACGLRESSFPETVGALLDKAQGGEDFEKDLLALLDRRKQADRAITKRTRAWEKISARMATSGARERNALPSPKRSMPVTNLLAACLKKREGQWEVFQGGKLIIQLEGRRYTLVLDQGEIRFPGRTPRPGETVSFHPGSWVYRALTSEYLNGSAFHLLDARDVSLDRVRERLERRLYRRGIVLEKIEASGVEAAVAGRFAFRGVASAGPDRHETLFHVPVKDEAHEVESFLEKSEKSEKGDEGGEDAPRRVTELEEDQVEQLGDVLEIADAAAEEACRKQKALRTFCSDRAGDAAAPRLGAQPAGFQGMLYELHEITAWLRHRDQARAVPVTLHCVPLSGVILDPVPWPEEGGSGSWRSCAEGHLVALDDFRACGAEDCTVGVCREHAEERGLELGACAVCEGLRCDDHAERCVACDRSLCAEHAGRMDDGRVSCPDCSVELDDGRRLPASSVAASEVSGRMAPKSELVASELCGKFALADEIEECPESGRKLLPSELGTCAVSGKRMGKDLLAEEPVQGRVVARELLVECAATGQRVLPEDTDRCARTGKRALKEELRACTVCERTILPEQGDVCADSGRFSCNQHLSTCEETGERFLPEEAGRCEVTGREARRSQLLKCPETGKTAMRHLFAKCEASSADVLPEGLEKSAVSGRSVRKSMLERCEISGKLALPDELETSPGSGKRVLPELLVTCPESGVRMLAADGAKCEESGDLCAPGGLATCAETGRRVRRSLLATDDATGEQVLERLLKECRRTGKRTVHANLGICAASGQQVLRSELRECAESGRLLLPEYLERCTASDAEVHPEMLVECGETGRKVLRRLAETCAASGAKAAPGVLRECAETGKPVLPSLLERDEVTGKDVLAELLETCELSGKKTLRDNMVRSAVSGKYVVEEHAEKCAVTGSWTLPSELTTCSVTGKRVLPELMGSCEVTNDAVMAEDLKTCDVSHRRVRPDLLETCKRSGLSVLPEFLGKSAMSGESGLKELLVRCEITGKEVFPDEMETSEATGRRFASNRANVCHATGRIVDVSETRQCRVCKQRTVGDDLFEKVCPPCLEVVGLGRGEKLDEESLALVQGQQDWVGSARGIVQDHMLHVEARRGKLGRFREPTLLVFELSSDEDVPPKLKKEVPMTQELRKELKPLAREHRKQQRG